MTSLSKCLLEESKAISEAAKKLNHEEVDKALNLIQDCSRNRGKILITGVGKSGIVSKKIAATFSSIGLMALYLNPVDALHGDLGIIGKDDICIILSNSGETEEIINLIPHLKRRSTKTIGIIGKKKSTLAQRCDAFLEASVDREVCPLNLAPTASTAVAMAIGDGLATTWMERSGISQDDFAVNHPAGQLGKKLTLKTRDIMIPVKDIQAISIHTKLEEIIVQITKGGIGTAWVEDISDKGKIIGIITDGDLRRGLRKIHPDSWTKLIAKDLMTKNPVSVNEDILISSAIEIMELNNKKPISVLPVVEYNQRMKGLLRLHDLIQAGLA